MPQFGKESLHTIQELATLIARTETLVASIGRMLPHEKRWLEWRHRAMVRKLEDYRRELKCLIETAQVMALQASVEDRQRRQG